MITARLNWSSVEKLKYPREHRSVTRAAYAVTDFDSDCLKLRSVA